MQVFVADRDVTIELEFLDGYDFTIPTAASYTIYDEDDVEVKASTAITPSSFEYDLIVVAADNQLGVDAANGFRRVEVAFTTAAGTSKVTNFSYVLAEKLTLTAGTNSFGSSGRMMIISTELGNIETLAEAGFDEAQIALAQAWRNIAQLSVEIIIDEVTYPTTADLTIDLLDLIPAKDKRLLQEAQLIEADFLLGGNPVEQRRRMGLMSESIGEVSQFFRTKKPLEMPVCRDTVKRLSKFIANSRKIGRA